MIFLQEPQGFVSQFEIAVSIIEHNGEVLLLLRQPWDTEGNKWSLPGGGVHNGETPLDAVVRETKEETSIDLVRNDLQNIKKTFVQRPERQFIMHVFYAKFLSRPEVITNHEEHAGFQWINPREAGRIDFIFDGLETINLFIK